MTWFGVVTIVAVWTSIVQEQPALALTGNVCYYQRRHVESRKTSCCFWGWGRRTVYRYYYTQEQRCCDGWRKTPGGSCAVPICNTQCYNGGTCVAPDTCRCTSSHSGKYCTTLLCSFKRPCYPGACRPPSDCTCSAGYGPDYGSNRCLKFTTSNPLPRIDRCEHTFAHVRRTDNKQIFHFRSLCGDDSTVGDLYWTNQALFNWAEFSIVSSYEQVQNMPPRPVYVSDSGFGIVKDSVKVLHTKVHRVGIYGPTETITTSGGGIAFVAHKNEYHCENGTTQLTPKRISHCSIIEKDYTTNLEHGDNLTATFVTKSGGFRRLLNTDTNGHYKTDYFTGQQAEKTVMFRFDFIAPVHCSNKKVPVSCPDDDEQAIYLGKDITKDPINVTWSGWSDGMSGISYYHLELFKLSLNIHGYLVEMKPLNPVDSFTSHQITDNSHTFTPPEAGMYSILLQASDHANNSRIARRLVLFDNTSSVTVSKLGFEMSNDVDPESAIVGDGGMYVTTAEAETGYRWQTSRNGTSTHFILDWQNHFRNLLHNETGLLNKVLKYPTQFEDLAENGILRSSKVVDPELDDYEGRRTMDDVPNINGIVKFQFKDVATADRTEPASGWLDLPLREQYSFHRILTDGSVLRLWVKATDVLNNTFADYTEVHIDDTPPLYSQKKLSKNVKNSTYTYTSIISFDAVDEQSGMHKISYEIKLENRNDLLRSVTVRGSMNNESDACDTDTACRCTLGQCFLADQTLYLDNCWFMVPKEELNMTAYVTVTVYNQALLTKSFTVNMGQLDELNGLEKYSGPTNIRVVKKLPYGVRLAWDLPKTASCYGRAEIVVILYQSDGSPSVHHVYHEAKTYDLVGLNPGQEYSLSLSLQHDGVDLATMPYQFTTAGQENYLSVGVITGAVAGVVVLLAIIIVVFVILLRRGHMKPVRRGVHAMSVKYRKSIATIQKSISAKASSRDDYAESLYMYGDMDLTASKSSHMTRNDVVFDSLLKTGNFADIYLARLESNNTSQVVAKVLKEGYKEADEHLMRAKINFSSLVVGQHENIVRFIGAVVEESEVGPFVIYEYCSIGALKNYLVDSKANVTVDLQENLFRFGLGIVRGMTYLAERKIVHRRLAARNILLDGNLMAKIHGFGPQPEEKDDDFKDKNAEKRERIPIRWCAPECLKTTANATEKSDVWSFGVVLWEIFSLGETPYGYIKGRELPSKVKAGERLNKPELCDDTWYSVMERAWHQSPIKRPSFKTIRDELDEMFVAAPTDDYYFYRR